MSGLQERGESGACIKVRVGQGAPAIGASPGTIPGKTGTIAETGEAVAGCAVFRQ